MPPESNVTAIGRPGWEGILGRMSRQPVKRPGIDQLHVDIEVLRLLAVPRKRHLLTIRGEGRQNLLTEIGCKRRGSQCGSDPITFRSLVRSRIPQRQSDK